MDISDTEIAAEAVRRGGVLVGDSYYVRLELTQAKTPSGDYKNHYKVKEVLEFRQGRLQSQSPLDFDSDET